MRVYLAPLINGSFGINDFPDGLLRVVADCAGKKFMPIGGTTAVATYIGVMG